MNVVELQPGKEQADHLVGLLEEVIEEVKRGEIVRLGLVFGRANGQYGTRFSSSDNRLIDAAMLMELAIRRLGFVME